MSRLDQVKMMLDDCVREELRDHAFGDVEVYWRLNDEDVASGYFGIDAREVYVNGIKFTGDDADALRTCGKRGRIERNDSTGPADYQEGETQSGLTAEGVLDELRRNRT